MPTDVSMGKPWVRENEKRQSYLDWLYEISDRTNKEHPFHALYVNLINERKETLLTRDKYFYCNNPQEVCQ
jgi:hypothetical protein